MVNAPSIANIALDALIKSNKNPVEAGEELQLGYVFKPVKKLKGKSRMANIIRTKVMGSKIQEELNDYLDLEPSKEIQRKIDFYFTPYIDKSKF